MDAEIIAMLGQDGVTNGAIALLALALVLVFAVTRVIFIPQGEFLAWGALTMAALEAAISRHGVAAGRLRRARWPSTPSRPPAAAASAARPCGTWPIRWRWRRCCGWPLASLCPPVQVLLTLAIVVPMGPMLYRVAFQPVAEAPVLVLLIISVAVHLAMVGLGLLIFGAEGSRTRRSARPSSSSAR
jgi:branched-chain amino acid transport system permease protein